MPDGTTELEDARRRGAGRRLIAAATRPPYGPALVIAVTAIVMASLFITSYSRALGRPIPHHIPTALVGRPTNVDRSLVRDLEREAGSALRLRPFASEATARRAIDRQEVYAALVFGVRTHRLLLASASVARVLRQAAEDVARRAHRSVAVFDVKPLPPNDPQGLVAFYVTLAATILGFVSMFQLRANAHGLSLRAWLTFIAALAVVAALVLALIVGPILGALRGPLAEMWGILVLEICAAALFNSTMLALVGRWAIVPTWLLFVVLGNTSSGGAVAPPLLPPFHAFIGRWLSPGATVNALRGAVYFPHYQHAEPLLVLAAWVVLGLAALLLVTRRRGTSPALPA